MKMIAKIAIAAAVVSGVSGLSAYAPAFAEMGGMAGSSGQDIQIVMNPGQGLPMDVGGKRVVGVYTQDEGTCGLTLVLAESDMGGMANGGTDAEHGTRISGHVQPGKSLRVDGGLNRAAEFLCGPDGRKMNARIYTRDAYQGKSAGSM